MRKTLPYSHRCTLALAVLLVSPRPTVAQGTAPDTKQGVECVAPLKPSPLSGTCLGSITTNGDIQRSDIALKVTGLPLENRKVVFKADKGTLTRDTVLSDKDGMVRTSWYRTAAAGDVGIAADVSITGGSVLQFIELKAQDTPLSVSLVQGPLWHGAYVGSSPRSPIYEIKLDSAIRMRALDTTESNPCSKFRFAFVSKASGATVTPDTASAQYYSARPYWSTKDFQSGCFVTANWRLGTEAEVQELRVSPVKMPGYRFTTPIDPIRVTARRLPQFVLAASIFSHEDYITIHRTTAPGVKVERTLPNGKITYDSLGTFAIDTVSSGSGGLAGAIIPIPLIPRIALAVGVDITEPKRNLYIGFSLAEFIGKYLPQKFPLDILLLAQRRRVDVLTSPVSNVAVCGVGTLPDPCATESRHVWARSIAFSIDAGSLLADVIKSIAK